jgi:TonB family protein
MKYSLYLAIGVCLIYGALVLAQNNAAAATRGKQAPAPGSNTQQSKQPPMSSLGGVEVLSDTAGVDFGPYLQSSLKTVKQSWYNLSPPIARAPRMMRGNVTIAFASLKTGKVAGMKLVENSGDVSLDRAAWGAIYDSKFSPLPADYSGQYLALRFHFLYNPAKASDSILQYKERTRP